MGNLKKLKYSLHEICKNQRASDSVERFTCDFHKNIIQSLNPKDHSWFGRTHKYGITYMCNKKKAFMAINIHQEFVSCIFFTGDRAIKGLIKANWMRKGNKMGSEYYSIGDNYSLKKAVSFSINAYKIVSNW
ncbi:MAG: hypothetical protein JXB49_32250 [Bacteroidales bacterium]|nr:hypothetical protein [Bacteroidales bacterium]